jgi:hypothetical protein
LPSSLNAATVAFMRYNLGTNVVWYCKSCWWVKCNCGCTQTCRSSSKLLFPLLHLLVVELLLLLLLWSTKELDLAHGNCTCCCTDDEDDITTSQKETLAIPLSLSLSLSVQEPAFEIDWPKCKSLSQASIRRRPKCKKFTNPLSSMT